MDQQIALSQEILSAIWILIYLAIAVLVVTSFRAITIAYKIIKSEVTFTNMATNLFNRGKYEAVIEMCRERIEKIPMDADAYFHLGRTCFRQKDYENAEENFNKAAALEPTWKENCVGAYLAQIEVERYSSSE
jgi:tetratricopeptide (TPR) repeat protein